LSLRILFAGTPEFALPALDALAASGHVLVGALTQPDRAAGRGLRTQPSPVKERALSLALPVLQPASLRDEGARAALASKAADVFVVVAYGLILPAEVLAMPRLGCVNVHASLLPRWRGASPIQHAILAGDEETGVSIMRMEAGLDTGPVYLQRATPIGAGETAGSLHDRLSLLGADALLEALPGIAGGTLVPRPQDSARATYAKRIDKREAVLEWSQPAIALERRVRAFNPWPICETRCFGESLRIWEAMMVPEAGAGAAPRAVDAEGRVPGAVVAAGASGIDVATGHGVLRLLRVQRPGKRPVSAADFANAQALTGAVLG
jgi:methionyl-tRNA formyltransferase